MEASGQHHVPVALPQGKNPVLIEEVDGWNPQPVRTIWRTEEGLPRLGFEPRTVQPVA
jgi:hypothetical protein